jgi:hypothetical protein
MEYIDLGEQPNDGTRDTMSIAIAKINKNFKEVFNKINIQEPLKEIVWKDILDTKKAMQDINYNFNKIQNHF